jgi:hypothetical protein
VLREHFEEPESDPTVWVEVDSAQVRRTVVALGVMAPTALRPIEDLIPIIYPGVRLSYGKVQGMAAEAEAQAGAFNTKADLSGVRAGALDELFSQGEPVLGGVDSTVVTCLVWRCARRAVARTGPRCSNRARTRD